MAKSTKGVSIEFLIIRDQFIPRLFNVVEVNWQEQTGRIIEKLLEFEDAEKLKANLDGATVEYAEIDAAA
jgi:hypothetical protein